MSNWNLDGLQENFGKVSAPFYFKHAFLCVYVGEYRLVNLSFFIIR
jgi:hypothetical protein